MDLTRALAFYAAVTATISLVFGATAAYNNLRDRPWIRLRFRVFPRPYRLVRPGYGHVVVDVANVGRRRALIYPPLIECRDLAGELRPLQSPDESWEGSAAWVPTDDADGPSDLMTLGEQESRAYLYHLAPGRTVIRATASDSLGRCWNRYGRFGRLRRIAAKRDATLGP